MLFRLKALALASAAMALSGCQTVAAQNAPVAAAGVANPAIWPALEYPVPTSAADLAFVQSLMARMTLEEKIGQVVQADLCCVTPAEVRQYNLGSVLNGGNSGPYGNDLAPAADWLRLADEFHAAATDTSDGGVGIPIIWGTDAVHGHSNIIGATIFPHNIGLGAARDVDLIARIGAATATEIRVTGQEWTFAPTVTVPQDFRWGRAYEGYSSDPALVASYVGAMVRGLQGPPDSGRILARGGVLASTKHFLADGGTEGGVDQGNANISEADLRDIHGRPYGPAIAEGVATVMASYSSWQGAKMTGNYSLLTGVLKERMDFGGFTVSDWNGHSQVAGCTNASCPQALLAGIDMYMAPDSWRALYGNLLAQAQDGTIPMARLDDAVRRILLVKLRTGVFEEGRPSARSLAGQYNLLGAPEHRAIAREAVRESLVLLKNQGVLPLAPGGRLLVAGDGADDIARASGGWTLTWQGTGIDNSHFPGATSLWAGLRDAVAAGGGTTQLSPDGSFTDRPDAAVVVFGEQPYAEFQGDRATLALGAELTGPYATMRRLRTQGIPVIAVMLTGRPLYVNEALNAADAFVVAWLPGSEGGGLADVLVGGADGRARHDFTGLLPAAWPRTPDMADGALFPFGYGLNYASPAPAWSILPEIAADDTGDARSLFAAGVPQAAWSLVLGGIDRQDETRITTFPAIALQGRAQITARDYLVQEGARDFAVSGGDAALAISTHNPVDLSREANGDVLLLFTLAMDLAPSSVSVAMRCEGANCGGSTLLNLPSGSGFVRYGVPLKCLAGKGVNMAEVTAPFILQTRGAARYSLAEVRLGTDAEVVLPCS